MQDVINFINIRNEKNAYCPEVYLDKALTIKKL